MIHIPRPRTQSLRVRLVLWYGVLVAAALALFVLLTLSWVTDALYQNTESAVHTEAQAAVSEVSDELLAVPPYWPDRLSLRSLNTYRAPGIEVEVIDWQGKTHVDSDGNPNTHLPTNPPLLQEVYTGHSVAYRDQFDGEPVQVEATAIRAGPAANKTVIGVLLVAKSLREINTTLELLRTLLFLTGCAVLVGSLLGSWSITDRLLQPLTEMAQTAQSIAATTARGTRIGNLSSRVRRPDGDDEIAKVVDALNGMLADLEKATQSQRRFVADASHELRAPLTTIQGNLAFLQRYGDEIPAAERSTTLHDAYDETLRLTRLVEELLLLARADAHIDTQPTLREHCQHLIELDYVVLQLVRQLHGRLRCEASMPKLEIGLIEPVRIYGDEETIRRILLALLDNALKYTAQSGPSTEQGRVLVSLERREKQALLQVSDTGMGIAEDELPHIFERFYRADRARSRQGTGLGLSIVSLQVEQLGGRITAESTPGQGSTFNVWLPLVW